jgi:hypothetical protein
LSLLMHELSKVTQVLDLTAAALLGLGLTMTLCALLVALLKSARPLRRLQEIPPKW